MNKRKICVVLVDRANYGRMKPVMQAIVARPELELQVLCAGTMVLERFGHAVKVVQADGFPVSGQVYMELEGSNPSTMAKSVGIGISEFSNEFQRLQPDVVVIIGDRYEALAAAISAAYMNLCIFHIQGGEVSGSIDESARHAISKFSHFHFPSTRRSAEFLERMGEDPKTIVGVGCPSSDLARTLGTDLDPDIVHRHGSGGRIDLTGPFLLVLFHPTTTEYGGERRQMEELLAALAALKRPTLLLWPNIDAGSDHISKAIRVFRDQQPSSWLHTITNLPPDTYLKVLSKTVCAIGNSSSFVRDAGFLGTPVVLVGGRQNGRETDRHVVRAKPLSGEILSAVEAQLAHGRYEPSTLYGDGHVAARIADALVRLTPYVQKQLHFVSEKPVS